HTALQHLLIYLAARSPFYQRMFRMHQVEINRIKTIEELFLLPTTNKSDMQENNDDFLCVPLSEVKEYTATSGTLGRPVMIALTESDLQRLAYNEKQSFLIADGCPEDI